MSFDQGAWDAITRLQNRQRRIDGYDASLDALLDRLLAQEERIEQLEKRFTDLKKAVWHA